MGCACAVDQTDLTKGRDASGEAVEEASRIGGRNPKWGRRPAPPGGLCPPALRVSFRVFQRPVRDLFVADKFRAYFALESLFSTFLEIDPGKYIICKTCRNCQFKP